MTIARFQIEKNDDGTFDLLMLASHNTDGIWDVVETYPSRAAAKAAIQEFYAAEGCERHYWAQYAHACGYHD